MSTTHTGGTSSSARVGCDDGISLVEVMVAMAVLSIMSVAVLRLLLGGLDVSEDSRQRSAASQLAAREVEVARNDFFRSSTSMAALAASGTVTNATPLAGGGTTLDGTAYTVQRSVQWVPTGNGKNACDGGTVVTHPSLRVSIAVSWADMGSTRPVTSETLLTPPKNTIATASVMYLAVKAQNSTGQGEPGVTATVSRTGTTLSQVTDDAGCAVFQVSAPGSWQASLSSTGYVDQTGAAQPTMTVTGALGQLVVASMTYDQAATVDVSLSTDAGFSLPSPYVVGGAGGNRPAIVFDRPNVAASLKRTVVANAGAVTRVAGLWPTTGGYAFWAGSCADSDPAATPTSGSRSPGVSVSPGATSTTSVRLAPVRVTVTNAGAPSAGTDVFAHHDACGAGRDDWLYLGRTGATGVVQSSLPHGQWYVGTTLSSYTQLIPLATGVTAVSLNGGA